MPRSARQIEEEVGYPGDRWDAPKERIQSEAIERFEDIRRDWLNLMWALDTYRKESVKPTRMRGATSDWTNRRKELKFAATDLKLYRRGYETQIDHWGVWKNNQPPKTYFLWAARLGPSDRIERMVEDVRVLVDTYLDGAGVFGWRESADETAYEVVPLPATGRAHDLDDVLHRIASEIRDNTGPDNEPPPPVGPPPR